MNKTKIEATRPTQSLPTSSSSPSPPASSSSSSWRSVGWKPLSYPLAALFHTNLVAVQSDPSFLDNDTLNQQQEEEEEEEEEENKTMTTMRLNPFFPLHKTVLVAALRELFLLDGVMDPPTFKVVLSSPQDVPVGKRTVEGTQGPGTKDEQRDCHFIAIGKRMTGSTSSMSATTTTTDTTSTVTTTTSPTPATTTTTTTTTTTSGRHFGEQKKKRKRIHVVLQEEPHATKTKYQQQQQQHQQQQQRQKLAAILNDNFKQGVSCGKNSLESSGEDFVQLVVEDMLLNHYYLQGHVFVGERSIVSTGSSKISTAHISSTSSIGSSSSSCVSSGKRDDQDNPDKTTSMGNIPRIRKVSDVSLDHDNDDDDNRTFHPFAAHVAVVAFNLLSERTTAATTTNITEAMGIRDDLGVFGNATRNGIDIDSISLRENVMSTFPGAERLLLHGGGDNTTNASFPSARSSSGNYNSRDHEKLLQFLYHTQQLPDMLDLSILLETYLRNVALNMVRRCFPIYASDKALREFMGYKSATATRMDRVLEILADYLFDVSHAMFAWEKTEIDCFGNKDGPDALPTWNHVTASRDEAICRMLFDERSLTKIGGFDPDSLLYHTVSIKSLESKNISWEKFAKSQRGKKMFSHHDDHSSRIKAGMKRRAKRMNNNIMTCRYRSSSVISNNEEKERYNNNDERLLGMGLVESDLIPITITREEGKSWGILLAKEDSMCVVMRAPDDSKLSVGDLIVSIRDNKFKSVNIPTTLRDFDTSSHDWFSNTIDIFKKSNMLHLEVRRVPILAMGRKTHEG